MTEATSNDRAVQATRRRVNPTAPEVTGFDFAEATLYVIQSAAGANRCVADMDDSQPVTDPEMGVGKWGTQPIVGVRFADGTTIGHVPDERMPFRIMLAPAESAETAPEVAEEAA